MSVGKKEMAPSEGQQGGGGGGAVVVVQGGGRKKKEARYARCFSGLELSVGPGPLRDVDAGRLKSQIRKWAKAVVAYARQISFGSPRAATTRSSSRAMSTRGRDGNGGSATATARSATFPSKSRLGEANNDERLEPAP
ncbi:hypothetical protein E2562_023120 [Oryza meyeriana var. granulata]|uniref:Uncharacterized protein n=1 Tax=Oryza meyeriana var. granulata TaxID=110450 RepID=A0A6G1E111_9ORYZ|nr:hypothetical protein E2562_023120 [Oryza meyeriana var. granulata]